MGNAVKILKEISLYDKPNGTVVGFGRVGDSFPMVKFVKVGVDGWIELESGKYVKNVPTKVEVASDNLVDWNWLQLQGVRLLGYATNNPVAIVAAEGALGAKAAIEESTGRTVDVVTTDIFKPGDVEVNWMGWLSGKWKLVILAILVIIFWKKIIK